jgi:hypothetical protein
MSQNPPAETDPVTSLPPVMLTVALVLLLCESPALNRTFADVVFGNVNCPIPVRVVVAISVPTVWPPVPSCTEYDPGVALSAEWLNESVVLTGFDPMAPTVGRIGRSSSMGQPAPDRWLTLRPIVDPEP